MGVRSIHKLLLVTILNLYIISNEKKKTVDIPIFLKEYSILTRYNQNNGHSQL